MIKIVYSVDKERVEDEIEWLRELKVYPSVKLNRNIITGERCMMFGMIVNKETAIPIKLRHNLNLQSNYFQR